MSAAQREAVRTLVEPMVAQSDCELEDVIIRQAGKRKLVRVVVDHRDGLALDLVASVSRAISNALDEADVLGKMPYVLEVTSPGVDRPLTLPRHWDWNVGRLVLITLGDGGEILGRIISVDEQGASLEVQGESRQVEFANIASARVQIEFAHVAAADFGSEDPEDDEDPDDDELYGSEG